MVTVSVVQTRNNFSHLLRKPVGKKKRNPEIGPKTNTNVAAAAAAYVAGISMKEIKQPGAKPRGVLSFGETWYQKNQ